MDTGVPAGLLFLPDIPEARVRSFPELHIEHIKYLLEANGRVATLWCLAYRNILRAPGGDLSLQIVDFCF